MCPQVPVMRFSPFARRVAACRRMDNPGRRGMSVGMTWDTDILIAGGGLNGPALALALAQGGFRVTVIDARPAPARAEAGFDGRAYALAVASVRLLSAIGVWSAVRDKAQPILEIKASDGRAGEGAAPFFLHFDAAEIEEGPMGHMLEDRFLYAAFLDAMRAAPGRYAAVGRNGGGARGQRVGGDGDARLGAAGDGGASGRVRRPGVWRGDAGGDQARGLGLWPDGAGHGGLA
jgi:2-polyprenyl-6-methoxyphenol hydroxylase-like FAD-dependent oxidoreductase